MEKIKCKFCKSEIDKDATICPNCKKTIKFPIKKWLSTMLFIIVVTIVVAFLSSPNSDKKDTHYDSGEDFIYEVTKSSAISNYSYSVEGIVTNLSNKYYSNIEIEFICYDEDGDKKGAVTDSGSNIDEKGTWNFKATGAFDNTDEIDHCIFKKISTW